MTVLRQLGAGDFDGAVVAIGSDIKASVLTVPNLVEGSRRSFADSSAAFPHSVPGARPSGNDFGTIVPKHKSDVTPGMTSVMSVR